MPGTPVYLDKLDRRVAVRQANAELLCKRFAQGRLARSGWTMQEHHPVPRDDGGVHVHVGEQQCGRRVLQQLLLRALAWGGAPNECVHPTHAVFDAVIVHEIVPQAMEFSW